MAAEITWIHHASFRIAGDGGVVYIDPWKIADETHDADVVLVSHNHFDHCSAEDVEKVCGKNTIMVAPAEATKELGKGQVINPGEEFLIGDILIQATPAYNIGKTYHPRSNNWIGAVVTIDGSRIYYAGDTDLVPEMGDLADIDLALLPVGGTYTLDAAEAAQAYRTINPKGALPYHWGDIVGSDNDAKAFEKAVGCKVHVLQPGDTVKV